MQKLINWASGEKKFMYVENAGVNLTQSEFRRRIAEKKRPPEIEKLVEALTAMWQRLDVRCGDCFAGKLDRGTESHGCCGNCPSLGSTACTAKPVGCALYTCGLRQFAGHENFERIPVRFHAILGKLRLLMQFAWQNGLMQGFYHTGYLHECDKTWKPKELQAATILAKLVCGIDKYSD